MDPEVLAEKLRKENLLSENSFQKISSAYSTRYFSLNLDLKTLLYIGILMLTSGLGIAIYKNIETIGHLAVILFIAAISGTCFTYCIKKRAAWSAEKVKSPNIFFDYVLLLGCLTFLSFTGYLQYEYSIFGSFNGCAFLIPAIIFFAAAYFFDHIGVLSMAISCLAAFLGITITPTSLISDNDFRSDQLIFAGLLLGMILVVAGNFLSKQNIKRHFTFTYYNFAVHLLFVCCLAGLFTLNMFWLFIPILGILLFLCIKHANTEHSFYFLLLASLYGYIGITYLFFFFLWKILQDSILALGPLYLIGSAVLMIIHLKKYWKKIKSHADLQQRMD